MKKWFSGIRLKLLLVSLGALVSLLAVGITGFIAISSLADKLDTAYNERGKLVEYIGEIEKSVHASVRWIWVADSFENDLKERQVFIAKTKTEIKDLDEAIKNYLALPKTLKSQNLFKQKFLPNWEISKKTFEEIMVLLDKNELHVTEKAKELITTKLRDSLAPVSQTIDQLQSDTQVTNKIIVSESLSYAQNAKHLALIVVILASLLCFILSIYVASQLVKILSLVASDLNNSSIQVSSAAQQIASSSEELSQATTEQAASLQETSSSIEEISSMINANTENAKQSSAVSAQSLTTAERGKVVVDHMIKAIGEINTSNTGIMVQIDETNKEIENIVKIINEIGTKTKVINDIVFQTKLLSFNASVEAARAGDQGKGFAVVAEEVGNLAAMSGAAALEITKMLEGSIKTVEGIVRDSKDKIGKLISTGKEKVETGTRVAEECETVLNEIVLSVASVSKMVAEISSASQEQAQGVHEITKAIAQLDQVTQENTANSAESANAAGTLSNQAEMLNSLVKKLVQTIEGGTKIDIKHEPVKSSRAIDKHNEKTISIQTAASNIPHQAHKKELFIESAKGELPSSNDSRFEDV